MRTDKPCEEAERTYEFVMDSVERILDLSTTSLTSDYRGCALPDARMMLSNVLKNVFGMSFVRIATLLNKDHATVMHYIRRHSDIFDTEPKYAQTYKTLVTDVSSRLNVINYRPVKNGNIKLRTVASGEKDQFDVLMTSFEKIEDAQAFVQAKTKPDDSVLYSGPTSEIRIEFVMQVVASDEKRYMQAAMQRSDDLRMIVMNEPIPRYYMDYRTGEFTILLDPTASFESACKMLGAKELSVIDTRRQQ